MLNRWIIGLVGIACVAATGLGSVAHGQPQQSKGRDPGCAEVAKSPREYVGKEVVFFGSLRPASGARTSDREPVQEWVCKTIVKGKGGAAFRRVPDVYFNVAPGSSTWTDRAGKANKTRSNFVVSGRVRLDSDGTVVIEGAHVALFGEEK